MAGNVITRSPRSAAKGLAFIADLGAAPFTMLGNVVAGDRRSPFNVEDADLPIFHQSQGMDAAMDYAGIPRPETPAGRTADAVVEAFFSGGPSGGGLGRTALVKGADLLAPGVAGGAAQLAEEADAPGWVQFPIALAADLATRGGARAGQWAADVVEVMPSSKADIEREVLAAMGEEGSRTARIGETPDDILDIMGADRTNPKHQGMVDVAEGSLAFAVPNFGTYYVAGKIPRNKRKSTVSHEMSHFAFEFPFEVLSRTRPHNGTEIIADQLEDAARAAIRKRHVDGKKLNDKERAAIFAIQHRNRYIARRDGDIGTWDESKGKFPGETLAGYVEALRRQGHSFTAGKADEVLTNDHANFLHAFHDPEIGASIMDYSPSELLDAAKGGHIAYVKHWPQARAPVDPPPSNWRETALAKLAAIGERLSDPKLTEEEVRYLDRTFRSISEGGDVWRNVENPLTDILPHSAFGGLRGESAARPDPVDAFFEDDPGDHEFR